MKVTFHQFLLIGLLEDLPQVLNSGIYLTFNVALVTKMAAKMG